MSASDTTINPLAAALAGLGAPTLSKDTAHFAHIGRFIVKYAAAEAAVHVLARGLSGLPDEKARAIFGGMRLSDLVDRVRAMLRLNKAEETIFRDVDDCLIQLDKIATKRHNIVHRLVEYESDAITVSNIFTAKSLLATEREVFKELDLMNMRYDCMVIYLRLTHVVKPEWATSQKETFIQSLYEPWRYIPPPPKTPKKPPRKARAKRKRQLPSSGA